ncbi:hypothetical protein N7527_006484, partial [Penicillium freii]
YGGNRMIGGTIRFACVYLKVCRIYCGIKPLEYSKEVVLAFYFDISVLNNGPKIVRELCLKEDMNDVILDRYEFASAISFVWGVILWNYGGREYDVDTLAIEL